MTGDLIDPARSHVGRRHGPGGAADRPSRQSRRARAAPAGEIPLEATRARATLSARRTPARKTMRPPRAPQSPSPALRRVQRPQATAGNGAARRRSSDSKIASQSIRVHVDTLEHLMTMVSELVLTRNQLIEIVRRHEESEFKAPLQRLSNVTAELQDGVLKTRMQPIGNAWQKLPRIVRDLSAELGKPIELEMHGAETELDRQVLDLIKDPLTHMVRNSADHGLEMPAERRRRRQARARHDPALRLPRGRSHHHRDLRRRARPRHRRGSRPRRSPAASRRRPKSRR